MAQDLVVLLQTKMTGKKTNKKRKAGLEKSFIEMSEDFDEPHQNRWIVKSWYLAGMQ